jgi:hypothetical protein
MSALLVSSNLSIVRLTNRGGGYGNRDRLIRDVPVLHVIEDTTALDDAMCVKRAELANKTFFDH